MGESLSSTYPNMLWEKAQTDSKGRTKSPKSVFISRLAEARRHRAYRRIRKVPQQAQVDENNDQTEQMDAAVAVAELSAVEAAVGPAGPFDKKRLMVLLRASINERKMNPPMCLPCYFLNEDIVAMEAEVRFKDRISKMLERLRLAKELVSEMCHSEMDFIDIDDYLRGKHAKHALITLEDFSEEHAAIPGPCIFWGTSAKTLCCGRPNEVIELQDSSLARALILCLTIYYIKDLTYPSAFGQTLGLVQTVVYKAEKFPHCWANSKLLKILQKLK